MTEGTWTRRDQAAYERAMEIFTRWSHQHERLPEVCTFSHAMQIARDEASAAEPPTAT